jgi:parafibromin
MDPLTLIRKASMEGASVINSGGLYIFGSVKYSEKAETSFKRSIGSSEFYYTVKDVIFFLENMDLSMQEYRKKVVSSRVTAIVEADKQDLRDYLLGTTSTAKQIDAAKAASVIKEMQKTTATTAASSGAMDVDSNAAAAATPAAALAKSAGSSSSGGGGGGGAGKSDRKSSGGSRAKRSREVSSGEFDLSKEGIAADTKKMAIAKKGDHPVADRCTVLRATTLGQEPFKFALNLFNQHILKPMDDAKKGVKGSSTDAAAAAANGTNPAGSKKSFGKPIIIVPQSFTTLINSTNAEDFLVNSKYVSVEEKRTEGAQRAAMQTLSRPLATTGGVSAARASAAAAGAAKLIEHMDFRVVDNPAKMLKDDEWSNVVAVFATGQSWQFKGWKKGYDTPVDLFSKVLGVHLVEEGAPIDAVIETWNCKVLKVHKYQRQKDNIVVTQFWTWVDNFLKVRRTEQAKYIGLI